MHAYPTFIYLLHRWSSESSKGGQNAHAGKKRHGMFSCSACNEKGNMILIMGAYSDY